MKQYVLATQQLWGVKVYHEVRQRMPLRGSTFLARTSEGLRIVLEEFKPRYAFFANWSSHVSPDILALSECVNFHCTALPYGRGGGPIENLILRGHTETVITAHRMVEELDAGPIYCVSSPVSLAGTKAEILDRFVEPVVDLICWIEDMEPKPYPQVGEVVNFTRLPKAEMEELWSARS